MYRAKRDKLKNRQGSSLEIYLQDLYRSINLSLCSLSGSLGESALLVLFHSLHIFMNIIHINSIRDCMFLNVLTAKFSSNDASGAKFANLLGEQSAAEWREFGNQMQWASSSHGSPVSYSSVSS